LRRLYEGADFKFERKGKLDENLRLLRHLGYLEFFITSELREGDNLSEKLKLTPLGRMLVELREERERANKAGTRT